MKCEKKISIRTIQVLIARLMSSTIYLSASMNDHLTGCIRICLALINLFEDFFSAQQFA